MLQHQDNMLHWATAVPTQPLPRQHADRAAATPAAARTPWEGGIRLPSQGSQEGGRAGLLDQRESCCCRHMQQRGATQCNVSQTAT